MPSSAVFPAARRSGRFCLKGVFPFSLSVPSYIIPAGITENLHFLKDKVDEVEIILFEGREYSNLPSPEEIAKFSETGLKFNVHLPLDLGLKDVDRINAIIGLTRPLNPTTWTLHINKGEKEVRAALERLDALPQKVSIENLDYDLRELADIILPMGFSVCLDMGHAWAMGQDLRGLFDFFKDRISIVHLHGLSNGKDHLPLADLEDERFREAESLIMGRGYTGTVSMEIFSMEHLYQSERILEWLK